MILSAKRVYEHFTKLVGNGQVERAIGVFKKLLEDCNVYCLALVKRWESAKEKELAAKGPALGGYQEY